MKDNNMYIQLDNKKIELQKKQRNLGSEAPAIRIQMLNGETKVIGMMADKVQVFITLPYKNSLSQTLENIINKYKDKSIIYTISSEALDKNVDDSLSSCEFKDFSLKMGVYVNDEVCAKSIFIINKDGEIVYKQILNTLDGEFDLELFDESLDEAIKFKKKGHTHENWMSA
jgi:thiol peroxidase